MSVTRGPRPEWPLPQPPKEKWAKIGVAALSLGLLGYGVGDALSHIVANITHTQVLEYHLFGLQQPFDAFGTAGGLIGGFGGGTAAWERLSRRPQWPPQ